MNKCVSYVYYARTFTIFNVNLVYYSDACAHGFDFMKSIKIAIFTLWIVCVNVCVRVHKLEFGMFW